MGLLLLSIILCHFVYIVESGDHKKEINDKK
jgi:hypothetical protein